MGKRLGYDAVIGGLRKAAESAQMLMSGGGDFYLEQLADIYEAFFQTCPLQPGDRCKVISDIDCSGGWAGNKHWLKPGAIGIVTSINWHKDTGFVANVVFEDESYQRDGKIYPVSTKHTWQLPVSKLRSLQP